MKKLFHTLLFSVVMLLSFNLFADELSSFELKLMDAGVETLASAPDPLPGDLSLPGGDNDSLYNEKSLEGDYGATFSASALIGDEEDDEPLAALASLELTINPEVGWRSS